MAVRNRVCGPTQCGIIASTTRRTKGGCTPDVGRCMPGASLSRRRPGQAPLGKPALQPYWGKPAVRNDRGDRGNVGIIRSPVRASILPDYMWVSRVWFGRVGCCPMSGSIGEQKYQSETSRDVEHTGCLLRETNDKSSSHPSRNETGEISVPDVPSTSVERSATGE